MVARWAHNPKVPGSSPGPATRSEGDAVPKASRLGYRDEKEGTELPSFLLVMPLSRGHNLTQFLWLNFRIIDNA